MAILSFSRAWQIMKSNKEHQLQAKLSNRGVHMPFEVSIDDQKMIDKKASDLNEIWSEYEVDLDGSSLIVCVFKKGLLGLATEVELYHADQLIPQGPLYSLPTGGDRPTKDLRHEPSIDRPEAMIPKLPSNCSACGAPLRMQNVE